MNITERMQILIKFKNAKSKDLEDKTGIDRDRWNNIKKTNPTAKTRAEEVEALGKIYPEFALWLISGKTLPEAGQISPELEETHQKLNQAG